MRRPRIGWLTAYVAVYLAFLYLPAALLPLFAFNDSTVVAFPLKGFTIRWFGELAMQDGLHAAVLNSLVVALATSILATALGVCAARASTRHKFRGKAGVMGVIMLPLFLPEIIIAVSLLTVLLQLGLPAGLWSVIAGHVLVCAPFSIAVLNSAFLALDRSLEEASMDLGHTRWSTFRLVTLPLVMPGIISSLLIGFTISLDEFIIAFFLSGNETTLPVYLWSQIRFPKRLPTVMALGTAMLLLTIVLLALAEHFRRRGARRSGQGGGLF